MNHFYPKATWLGNGRTSGNYTGGPWKVCLHTTETRGLPSYRNGYSAPHLTWLPSTGTWIQHTKLTLAARALRNGPHPVQTNRDSVIQLEMVCYSDRSLAESVGGLWVGHFTDEHYAELREFLEWCHEEFGVVMKWPGRRALSYRQANASGFRLTPAEWDRYDGVLGHQHVPDTNTHWDPGALDWKKLFSETEDDEMTLQRGDVGDTVRMMQRALLRWDPQILPRFGADGDYGDETIAAVKAFQSASDLEETGIIDGLTAAVLTSTTAAESFDPTTLVRAVEQLNSRLDKLRTI